MVFELQGHLLGQGRRFGIVLSRWNSFIGDHLLRGALDAFTRHGVQSEDLCVVRVPGSFELPLGAQKLARQGTFDGIVCLGVLIRGATPHFDFIAAEATKGLAMVGLENDLPVSYGLLTCDTLEQAIERAGTKAGNKGAEAATAVLEMANLFSSIENDLSAPFTRS
ncbi:MAG: 6,7-dimethyl-8-ribityllumazine synthase [Planctomycetes bacterium]|nr:6,7-dimethyl-8-ribityllumazine synthase [Planctomycetota bacterium]MCB9891574.1 6,7-dimethyl-8-ribityllumazine synthase [Planctomycetota bacterium]